METSQEPRPRLYLIDGFANIFRAFYAIRNLSNSKGEATNAVFGFLQMLRKLLEDEEPAYVGVAFDVGRDTVRSEKYEEYKANRAPMPEDLRPQVPWIRKVIEAYKIPILEMPKYEADDVLGTLAKKASAAGYEVHLLSADKDLMQLVGDGVYLYHTGRSKLYDSALVEEDFGVPPEQVVDVLALMGDASDNVPGVPGIGAKGAQNLIREHGSVEALLEKAGEVKRKSYREGLEQNREQALLSKELVTIHRDLPLEFEPEKLRREDPDLEALVEICREMEFHSLLKELEGSLPSEEIPPARELEDVGAWQSWAAGLGGKVYLGLVGEGEPVGLAASDGEEEASGEVVFADFRREGLQEAVAQTLTVWLEDADRELLGHDLKEILRLSSEHLRSSSPACSLFDTMLGSYLLRPALRSHELADVALDRLHHKALASADARWVKGEAPPLGEVKLLPYAAERVELPRRMAADMAEELEAGTQMPVYREIEEPLVTVLLRMEELGVGLDVPFLETMSGDLGKEIEALEGEIHALAGEEFNINSPKQLGVILFEKLEYPVLGRTRKTKSYSTGAETLEELASRGYPLPGKILAYRELAKLKSTYVDALPLLVASDGRLHTRFNQAVAATGRLSSAHPNLQNIPVRTERGQQIRKAFRAEEGFRLVVADYSQIELRVLAHIAEEEAMLEAFRKGKDIHTATAAAVLDVAAELVGSEQRRAAKTINFGIIYGMSSFGLARQLGIGRKEAEEFIAAYFERYPGVARYTEETVESARETGKVETLYGRIRRLPDINSRNYSLRENAKRMAINARIQGTAADLLKLAMIAVDRRLRREHPRTRLLLTVHDELVLEVPEGDVDTVGSVLQEEMEGVAELSVPLVVDFGSGKTWYEAKG